MSETPRTKCNEARVKIERLKFGRLTDEATKTPRTQAAIKTYGDYIRSEDAVSIEFAEQLETELAEARAEIERLKKNLRLLLCKKHLDECENGLFNSRFPDDEPCLICVAEAAERGE